MCYVCLVFVMNISRKISLWYFVLGVIYIAVSDVLLSVHHGLGVVENFSMISESILKGWIFITITAVLLYAVLSKYIRNIHEQRRLRDLVVNNTRDMLWMVDSSFTILLVNKTFVEALSKESESELLGFSALQFGEGKADLEKWKSHYERALRGERFHSVETFGNKDGRKLEFEFHFYQFL